MHSVRATGIAPRRIRIALVAVLIGAAAAGTAGTTEPGARALFFGLPDLDGTYQHTKQWFRQEKVIVCFFASWCTVCPSEFEFIDATLTARGRNPRLIGVAEAPEATPEKVRSYLQKHAVELDVVLLDESGRVGRRFGLADTGEVKVPHTVMIDENGIIAAVIRGFDEASKTEFESVLDDWYGPAGAANAVPKTEDLQ